MIGYVVQHPFQQAELEDALTACDELSTVISRLKRLGLLTTEENLVTRTRMQEINDTLLAKLPAGARGDA